MFLSAFLASLALLGPAAVTGQSSGVPSCSDEAAANCIACTAKAFSSGFSLSRDEFVGIGLNLAKSVCEGDESINVAVEVEGIAFAVAEAIAVTSVECDGQGQVEGTGMAIARAEANATATATAIAEGFASIETCNGCTAAIRVLAQSTETAFVNAIAESSTEILDFVPLSLSNGGAVKMQNFVVAFAEKLIPVYAGIIADVSVVSTPPEETCTVTVAACTEAGDEGACCAVTVDQAKVEIGENAYVSLEAIATLKDEACIEDADLSVTAVAAATATGKAFALSLSKIFGFCATTTDSDACFWASGSIEAVAEAEAVALAEVTADVTTCNCSISIDAVAESYQEVLVSTIAIVQADVCVLGEGIVDVEAIAVAVEMASVEALAAILVEAYSTCEIEICAATETKVNGASSSSFCCVETQPHVETYSEDAIASAIAEAIVTTCTPPDEQPDLVARATVSATALAQASALAVAAFSVECGASDEFSYACGGGDVAVRAMASATAEAYSRGWASSNIGCGTGNCSVTVETTTELVETIFVDAVAAVWGEVCTSGADDFDVTFYMEKFAEEQLMVTAEAIAAAAWYQDNGTCAAVTVACVGDDPEDPNPAMSADACCSGVLSSFPDNPEVENATATAVAQAFAGNFLCAPEAETESTAEQFVRAVATAFARAVTFVNADCTAPEGGTACFIAESSITASAEAFATTIASSWAQALNGNDGCGCVAQVDALEETTRTVLASATLEVLRNVCVDDGETYTESIFVDELVANHLTVFADAFATAKAGFDSDGEAQCTVFVDVDTGTVVPPTAAPLADDGEEIATAAIASDSETIEI